MTDGVFGQRAREVVRGHMEAGESVDARQVLRQLGVKRASEGRARRIAAQEILKLYTQRVRDWAIEHPHVQRFARLAPSRGDRAWALRKVAVLGRDQLPGVDFDAVHWQAIVDAVTGGKRPGEGRGASKRSGGGSTSR